MIVPEAPPPEAAADDPAGRPIIEATLRLVARHGLARLTIDDVAAEAGVSRATLYRRFPGKAALLQAVVAAEAARLQAGLDDVLSEVHTLDQALAAAADYGARELAGHAALQYLLTHEPGSILPSLCFGAGDRLLDVLAGSVAPNLCRFLPPLQARRVGEWLARVVLSYGLTPSAAPGAGAGAEVPAGGASGGGSAATDSGDEAAAVQVVRRFVAPALEPPGSRRARVPEGGDRG